jgi:hypothetical protein
MNSAFKSQGVKQYIRWICVLLGILNVALRHGSRENAIFLLTPIEKCKAKPPQEFSWYSFLLEAE